jgi:hypothetical protein
MSRQTRSRLRCCRGSKSCETKRRASQLARVGSENKRRASQPARRRGKRAAAARGMRVLALPSRPCMRGVTRTEGRGAMSRQTRSRLRCCRGSKSCETKRRASQPARVGIETKRRASQPARRRGKRAAAARGMRVLALPSRPCMRGVTRTEGRGAMSRQTRSRCCCCRGSESCETKRRASQPARREGNRAAAAWGCVLWHSGRRQGKLGVGMWALSRARSAQTQTHVAPQSWKA